MRWRKALNAAVIGLLLGGWLSTASLAQSGPFSAQIIRALRAWGFSTPGVLNGLADGSATNVSLGFLSDAPANGFYKLSTGVMAYSNAGVGYISFADNLTLRASSTLRWSSGAINAATDTTIGRAGVGQLQFPTIAFAGLGTPANGAITFCSDCTVTTAASCPATQASCVCAGAGTGAFARRVAGAWYCTF